MKLFEIMAKAEQLLFDDGNLKGAEALLIEHSEDIPSSIRAMVNLALFESDMKSSVENMGLSQKSKNQARKEVHGLFKEMK